jgi:hypothetical protein
MFSGHSAIEVYSVSQKKLLRTIGVDPIIVAAAATTLNKLGKSRGKTLGKRIAIVSSSQNC